MAMYYSCLMLGGLPTNVSIIWTPMSGKIVITSFPINTRWHNQKGGKRKKRQGYSSLLGNSFFSCRQTRQMKMGTKQDSQQ